MFIELNQLYANPKPFKPLSFLSFHSPPTPFMRTNSTRGTHMSITIRTQLFAGFGLLALLVMVIGAVAVIGARSSTAALERYQESSSRASP